MILFNVYPKTIEFKEESVKDKTFIEAKELKFNDYNALILDVPIIKTETPLG